MENGPYRVNYCTLSHAKNRGGGTFSSCWESFRIMWWEREIKKGKRKWWKARLRIRELSQENDSSTLDDSWDRIIPSFSAGRTFVNSFTRSYTPPLSTGGPVKPYYTAAEGILACKILRAHMPICNLPPSKWFHVNDRAALETMMRRQMAVIHYH